ncbi:hypothetical protein OROHE_018206 [Orobanche hederae]
MPSQEILKIRDGTPLEAEEILTYIKMSSKRIGLILFFKIRPSQEILKIRDGTPLEAEELLTYIKSPRNGLVWHFSSKLDVPSNVLQKKIVAWILFFKIKPSQEIPKIRDGTRLEAEEILTYIKRPSKQIIRDGTPLEAEELLTYIKSPRNGLVWHFSSKLDVPSNIVQKKRVAPILFFKIRTSQEIIKIRDGTPLERPSQEILKIRDGTPLEILFFKIRPSQEILKIRDGTPLEAEELLTYIKSPRNGLVWHFSSKLDVPSNVLQKKIVAWILFFKIKPSQEIPKIRDGTRLEAEEILTYIKRPSKQIIRDGTPLEAEELLTYIKSPRNGLVWHFSSKLDVPSNIVQKKRVAPILFFKIRTSQEIIKIRDGTPLEMPSQEILKIRDGTPLEAEEILTCIKMTSQEILKIRDGTPLEAEELLTYIKSPRNGLKIVAWILFFKIKPSQEIPEIRDGTRLERPSQEILKIRDGTPLEAEEILTYIKMSSKRIGLILFFKIRPSQEILKIRDGTPLEAEELLTYIKSPRNELVWHFSSKLDVPSNVLQKKIVAWILFFKIKPSQEIPKIRDGTRLEAEEILTYIKRPSKQIIRDGTPLEAEELLTYIKSPRNGLVWHFSSKLDVPSNIVQKKRVAPILFFKIRTSQEIIKIRDGTPLERPSQEILKIRDGTPLEAEEILTYIKMSSKRIGLILFFKIRPSQEILKIRDGTPLEAEELLTYIKSPRNGLVWHFSSKLDVPSNVLQKKIVAWILFFKIKPSQEIPKIRDGTRLEAEEILTYIKRPSKQIIRDGTPLEAEELLTYIKSPRNGLVWHFSSKLDVPSNIVQKKRVAPILFFKIRTSQEIIKIRDGTPLEAKEILTYTKKPSKRIGLALL